MSSVVTLRHGCEHREGASAQVWTEAYCQAKRKTGEQNHFCERERKTEQKPEAQWKDRPGKPQAQPIKTACGRRSPHIAFRRIIQVETVALSLLGKLMRKGWGV